MIEFSHDRRNDCGRLFTPCIDWMDDVNPHQNRNNRKRILIRTTAFFHNKFDRDEHVFAFTIYVGKMTNKDSK